MNIGLGRDEEVAEWKGMEIPDTAPIRAKVAHIERRGLGTKFTFVKLGDKVVKPDDKER
jgi:hypothetical protein